METHTGMTQSCTEPEALALHKPIEGDFVAKDNIAIL